MRLANCLDCLEFHESGKIDVNVADIGLVSIFSSVYGACMKTHTKMFVASNHLRFF